MQGVRLKWNCPGADPGRTKDGSIIDNPPTLGSHIVYDGLDGELYNLAAPHVSTVGLTMGKRIRHNWLVYAHGHTTKLNARGDILTGPMSGCLITEWKDRGLRYVGHVGTIESSASVNIKVKSVFARSMPRNTKGFNPANAWAPGEIMQIMSKFNTIPGMNIMALVTSSGKFFSVLMFKMRDKVNEWCVGGAKRVQPMRYQALKRALTS